MAFSRKKQQNEKESAMESSTSTKRVGSSKPKTSKSGFKPTVCLKDWWLKRTEADSQGRTLAVAGNTSREGQAMRVFSSAPILKAFDVFTLETIDGICVVLKGFINKTRSEENGFPSEVFEQFLFGFPPQWEVFNKKYLGRESKGKAAANDDLGFEKPSACSEKVKDLKKHNGRKGYELEDNLKRDDKNDGKIASEVIVRKMTRQAERWSSKLNCRNTSTSTAKEQTSDYRTTRFKSASASATTSAKRKLTYETPQKEKEAVPVISPEPSSFKRSRSGRLLLPPMEFWRNQMAIYDADREVTAIKQGNMGLDNLSIGTNGGKA
ncbi:PREDICTED: protein EMBRYO DEFECTIVE 1674-like isoform X2 [Nicotiana attenuata]|uniref:protein EMBRYO DEFECTIVE 1674-like isoform X2 n=1 Tax=Nicotiana attenuata TaxID=49451 RepID=UPI0009047EAE|nr:PREDICTED: protein EMBRYO DEFECTIVE 1674-like isoform X2 [Nicotiana attenuata]